MAFDQTIANTICERLSLGEPLAQICRDMKMGRTTVYDWQESNPPFAVHFTRARVRGYDAIADDIMSIADSNLEPNDKRVRTDVRLKLLAKWDPKRYGDRLQTDNDTRIDVTIRDLTKEPSV